MTRTLARSTLRNSGLNTVQAGPGGILVVDEGGGGIEIRADFAGGTGLTLADDTTNGTTVRSGSRAKLEVFGYEVLGPDDTGEARIFAQDGDGAQLGVWIHTRAGGTPDEKYIRIGTAFDAPLLEILASGEIGFNAATPVAQPVVPLTGPTVQDVIDALVARGDIVQHD